MESRRLLAVTAGLVDGTLQIALNAAGDEATLVPSGLVYVVSGTGLSPTLFENANVEAIEVVGSGAAGQSFAVGPGEAVTDRLLIADSVARARIDSPIAVPSGNIQIDSRELTLGADMKTSGDIYVAGSVQLLTSATVDAGQGNVTFADSLTGIESGGGRAWATKVGGSDIASVKDISVHIDGTVLITGGFHGTADFGDIQLTSAGSSDAYIAKLYADGTYAWATRVGGADFDQIESISTLADGSAIVTGRFQGTVDFGDTQLSSAGHYDVFIAKLNADGSYAWATRAGGSSNDYGFGISTFPDGSSIVVGSFAGTADFGDTQLTSAGSLDFFITKLNADGSYDWAVRGGDAGNDQISDIAVLLDGTAIVTGYFSGSVAFGSESLTTLGSWDNDVFIAKLNADGSFAWANSGGGSHGGWDNGLSVATFPDGSAIVSGIHRGTITFGDTTLSAGQTEGYFVAKLNSDGTYAWVKNPGTRVYGVLALADGSVIVVGSEFVAKLNSDGSNRWATSVGNPGTGKGWSLYDVAATVDGGLIVGGEVSGAATLGSLTLEREGISDGFVANLNPDGTWPAEEEVPPQKPDLTVIAGGMARFDGAVKNLNRFTTSTGGMVRLSGDISTAGDIIFGDDVALTESATISSGAGNITFGGELNGVELGASGGEPAGAESRASLPELTIESHGTTRFESTVANLSSLSTDAGGVTHISDSITTSESLSFGDDIVLAPFRSITLTSVDVTFANVITGIKEYRSAWVTGVDEENGGFYEGFDIATLADGSAVRTGLIGVPSGNPFFPYDYQMFVERLNTDGSSAWITTQPQDHDVFGRSVSVFADGSSVVTGSFYGSASFGSAELTSAGSEDIYVAKLNPDGSYAWATRAGGTGLDSGQSISVLADGSCIVTGYFRGAADFGGTQLTSALAYDTFVAKLNADGSYAWATRVGGVDFVPLESSVSVLADGSSIVTGTFEGTVDFGDTQLSSAGQYDVFIAKLNADGSYAWATRAGGTSWDSGASISVLADGSCIVTGRFSGTATFGSTQFTSGSAGSFAMFIAKLNPDGSFAWVTRSVGEKVAVNSVATLDDGGVLVAGQFWDTVAFGSTVLNSSRGVDSDIFIAKLNPDGSFDWATRAGGLRGDIAWGISSLPDGSAIVTGHQESATFGNTSLTFFGDFTAKINPDGTWTTAEDFIAMLPNLTIFASGTTQLNRSVTDLASLTVSGGTTHIGGDITTARGQSFGGDVVLQSDAMLTGDSLHFSGGVDGGESRLVLNANLNSGTDPTAFTNITDLTLIQPRRDNAAATAVTTTPTSATLPENTDTTHAIKVADIRIDDDDLGGNEVSLSGPEAEFFTLEPGADRLSIGLFLKAGTNLDFETKENYSVSVHVRDSGVSGAPSISTNFTLSITDVPEILQPVLDPEASPTLGVVHTDRSFSIASLLVGTDAPGLAITGLNLPSELLARVFVQTLVEGEWISQELFPPTPSDWTTISATSAIVLHTEGNARLSILTQDSQGLPALADIITFKAWSGEGGFAHAASGVDTTESVAFSIATDTVNSLAANVDARGSDGVGTDAAGGYWVNELPLSATVMIDGQPHTRQVRADVFASWDVSLIGAENLSDAEPRNSLFLRHAETGTVYLLDCSDTWNIDLSAGIFPLLRNARSVPLRVSARGIASPGGRDPSDPVGGVPIRLDEGVLLSRDVVGRLFAGDVALSRATEAGTESLRLSDLPGQRIRHVEIVDRNGSETLRLVLEDAAGRETLLVLLQDQTSGDWLLPANAPMQILLEGADAATAAYLLPLDSAVNIATGGISASTARLEVNGVVMEIPGVEREGQVFFLFEPSLSDLTVGDSALVRIIDGTDATMFTTQTVLFAIGRSLPAVPADITLGGASALPQAFFIQSDERVNLMGASIESGLMMSVSTGSRSDSVVAPYDETSNSVWFSLAQLASDFGFVFSTGEIIEVEFLDGAGKPLSSRVILHVRS